MQYLLEIFLGLLLIYVSLISNHQVTYYSNTTLGKIIMFSFILFLSSYKMIYGILGLLIYIILTENGIESMESMSKSKFRKKYCKNNVLDKDSPSVKFKNKPCNPCDKDCDFIITSSKEQLTTDEKLRPKESNALPVNKSVDMKKVKPIINNNK